VAALADNATAEYIPQDELLAGNQLPYLRQLLAKPPNGPEVELNGAQVAAEKLIAVLA